MIIDLKPEKVSLLEKLLRQKIQDHIDKSITVIQETPYSQRPTHTSQNGDDLKNSPDNPKNMTSSTAQILATFNEVSKASQQPL